MQRRITYRQDTLMNRHVDEQTIHGSKVAVLKISAFASALSVTDF